MTNMETRLLLALALVTASLASLVSAASLEFEITIPDAVQVTEKQDAYMCTTLALPDKPYKLVGVEPLGKKEIVHHILLFGCDVPFAKPKAGQQSVWNCKMSPACSGASETIMYGWGKDAPRLDLPEGVGFSVGKGSAVKWVVAQVHYLNDKPEGDKSGVRLTLQDTPVPFSAGLLSFASWFTIPPRKQHYLVQNSCCYRGFQPLTTFAVRVHTHTMGRSVFMTRMPTVLNGRGHLVASGDPQKPQGFNPVQPQVLWPGDHLMVACDFDSMDKTVAVGAGPTHEHEMCNMYLMVYSQLPHIEMCSDGSSLWDERSPGNMPRAAALLPDPFPLWRPPTPTDAVKTPNNDTGVLGNAASVAVGPDGTLWALHRGGRVWDEDTFDVNERITEQDPIMVDVVLQMHPDTGKVLRRWGAGHFWMPHMITVDRNGSVWITDVGRHQVLKFTSSGKLIMSVGKKLKPGHGPRELCKPTQVAFLNDGSFLVSDGYCNSRVVLYRPDGSFGTQYELPKDRGGGHAPGGSGMAVAHSVVVDECDREVAVADREFSRVHRFDLDTKELKAITDVKDLGKVWALTKGPYGRTLALAWKPGTPAALVDVAEPSIHWQLPNSTNMWPHDLALGPAPLQLTGAGDRLLAVYVAPLCEECGPVHKFVVFPQNYGPPDKDLPPPHFSQAPQKPVLAHLGGHPAAQAKVAAAAAVAAKEQEGEDGAAAEAEVQQEAQQDGGQVDEAAEQQDEQQEEAVEKEEQQEYEEEAKEMADPKEVQRLQEQLQELQQQVNTLINQDEKKGVEEYQSVHFAAGKHSQGHGWAAIIAVVTVSLLLGGGVGALAVHLLGKHAATKSSRAQPLAAERQPQSSIDEMLRDPEVDGERHGLLAAGMNGLSSGALNGVHSARHTQR